MANPLRPSTMGSSAHVEPPRRCPKRPLTSQSWIVAAAEAVAIAAGIAVLAVVLHAPRATFGWITPVVGVHFFGLTRVWGLRFYVRLAPRSRPAGRAGLVAASVFAGVAVITAILAIVAGVLHAS